MFPFIIITIFIIASLVVMLFKNEKQMRLVSAAFAILGGGFVFAFSLPMLFGAVSGWSDSLWLLDRFSALMASLIAFVYIAATFVSVRYIGHEYEEKIITLGDLRLYFALIHIFALSMIVSVLANNVLILWIALESTTLASTFLVGLYRRKTSVEAAWKYIIICSTGITLGLLGILFLGHGLSVTGIKSDEIFLLTSLSKNAHLVSPEIIRLAFVFIFIGFGAKVGFAPMHVWLPDAHSKAPSPISAMFSGILLNVALYAIIRFKFITDNALGQDYWTNNLFLFFGAISIFIPAFMMIVQKNYKRMLAYSSVEHMGLISFAIALSPIGLVAAIIHMIGHTLTKSMLFFGAGEILLQWKTTKTEKVRGLLKYAPYTAILFLLGILAIIALPPSALFVSEYMIFSSALATHPYLSLVIFAALTIIAFSMLRSTLSMFQNENSENNNSIKKEKWNATHSIMVLQLIMIIIFSIWASSDEGLKFINLIVEDIIRTTD